jgi:hypothetical protein
MVNALGEELLVWTEPSCIKIFKESEPKMGRSRLILQSARNEYESGQIVLRAEDKPIKVKDFIASPLKGPNGYSIGRKISRFAWLNMFSFATRTDIIPTPSLPSVHLSSNRGKTSLYL